jgi:hypothetical protein
MDLINPWRRVSRAAILGMVVVLASCIDGHEEFWMDAKGAGRAEISYSLPANLARLHGGDSGIHSLIADFFAQTPTLRMTRQEVVTADGRTTVRLGMEFDSALDLVKASEGAGIHRLPAAAAHLAGEVHARWRGRTLEVTRTSTPGKLFPGRSLLPVAKPGGRLLTILHLPVAANTSNATRTENDGRTLVWDIPLAEAVTAPVTYRFQVDAPLPWHLLGWIIPPVALLCGLIWARRARARADASPVRAEDSPCGACPAAETSAP